MPDGTLPGRARPASPPPYPYHDHELQAKLAAWNRARLRPQAPRGDWRAASVTSTCAVSRSKSSKPRAKPRSNAR